MLKLFTFIYFMLLGGMAFVAESTLPSEYQAFFIGLLFIVSLYNISVIRSKYSLNSKARN